VYVKQRTWAMRNSVGLQKSLVGLLTMPSNAILNFAVEIVSFFL